MLESEDTSVWKPEPLFLFTPLKETSPSGGAGIDELELEEQLERVLRAHFYGSEIQHGTLQ